MFSSSKHFPFGLYIVTSETESPTYESGGGHIQSYNNVYPFCSSWGLKEIFSHPHSYKHGIQ